MHVGSNARVSAFIRSMYRNRHVVRFVIFVPYVGTLRRNDLPLVSPSRHRVAVIPGDGIGREVVPAGQEVLEAAARRFGFALEWQHFDWSCERFARTGSMMPSDGLDQLRQFDAIYLGAVGYPGVPDHVSLGGLLLPIRRGFEQYVNLRPARLLRGVASPLRDRE